MKASGLRLGNLVKINGRGGDCIYRVTGISETDIDAQCINRCDPFKEVYNEPIDNVRPAPLTEDWLVRFGFKRLDKGSVSAQFYIGENPLTHDWLFDLKWIKDYEKIPPYPFKGFAFYRNGLFEVKHVNQLQNLYFALTGEELTLIDAT